MKNIVAGDKGIVPRPYGTTTMCALRSVSDRQHCATAAHTPVAALKVWTSQQVVIVAQLHAKYTERPANTGVNTVDPITPRARNFVAASPRNFAGRNVISWRRQEIRSAPIPVALMNSPRFWPSLSVDVRNDKLIVLPDGAEVVGPGDEPQKQHMAGPLVPSEPLCEPGCSQ